MKRVWAVRVSLASLLRVAGFVIWPEGVPGSAAGWNPTRGEQGTIRSNG
jgi:hypothetical protein